jgi:hypothetical protein
LVFWTNFPKQSYNKREHLKIPVGFQDVPQEDAMADTAKNQATRVMETGVRESTVLETEDLRVLINDQGGMTPELSSQQEAGEKGRINAHWLPWFRSPDRSIAGNFPCIPNFGPAHTVDGIEMPGHGWSSKRPWHFEKSGADNEVCWALSVMDSPESAMPLSFRKLDVLVPGHKVHYSSVSVKNRGKTDMEICAGWHNTLGAPFLAAGARLSACADAWITAPKGSEFEATTRFVTEAEFSSLKEAPLLKGGKADLSIIPGPIGYTDFAAGRVPFKAPLGWSSVVNPVLKMAYICFFTGPAAAGEDDIILRFNDLWMQYGGRPFPPWAAYEGGTDLTYCLGTENAAAAFAQGLEYSRRVKKILDAPTTVLIPAGGEKILRYGTLFASYGANGGKNLDEGIESIEAEEKALVCKGRSGHERFNADPRFTLLKVLEKKIS